MNGDQRTVKLLHCGQQPACKAAAPRARFGARAKFLSRSDVNEDQRTVKLLHCGQQPACKAAAPRARFGVWAKFISRSDVNEDQRTDKAAALRQAAGL